MKAFIGIALIIIVIIFGLWAGIWWAFIGGVVNLIEAIRAPELSTASVAVGVVKIVCSAFIGWIAAALFITPGLVVLGDA